MVLLYVQVNAFKAQWRVRKELMQTPLFSLNFKSLHLVIMQGHTLSLYVQYGDDHVKEVEELWGALCRWRKNIHITINFLIHIARVSSSSALLQHVKKIIVCFVRTQQIEIIEEVIDQLKVYTSHLLK